MKKKFLFGIELFSYISIIVAIIIYGFSVYNTAFNFDVTKTISKSFEVLAKSFVLIFVIACFIVFAAVVIKEQKANGFEGLFTKTRAYFKNRKKLFTIIVTSSIIIFLVLVIVLFQGFMLYVPSHDNYAEQKLIKSNSYEKINFTSSTKTSYSGWGKLEQQNEHTIIYFGGNKESSANYFYNKHLDNWKSFEGFNYIMIDYPGYGLNKGTPNQKSIYKMSLEVYDYVAEMEFIDSNKIIVKGYSLGTGPATYLAANKDIYKLVLIAPYSSMTDAVNTKVPIFYGPLKYLIRSRFEAVKYFEDVSVDSLLIYSSTDKVIKPKLTKKLAKANNKSTLYKVEGLIHRNMINDDQVLNEIKSFILL